MGLSIGVFKETLPGERRVALAQRGPLVIDDGIPGGVAVAALVHDGLAEDALEAEAEPFGRPARRRVQRIALPLEAPVTERVEDMAHEQRQHFGGHARALQARRHRDVADLDHAHGRIDAHEGCVTDGT